MVAHVTGRQSSPEEIERGLTALILAGSSTKASEAQASRHTLRDWKNEHADSTHASRNDLEPRIVKKIAAEAEGLVVRLASIQHDVLDQFEAKATNSSPQSSPPPPATSRPLPPSTWTSTPPPSESALATYQAQT